MNKDIMLNPVVVGNKVLHYFSEPVNVEWNSDGLYSDKIHAKCYYFSEIPISLQPKFTPTIEAFCVDEDGKPWWIDIYNSYVHFRFIFDKEKEDDGNE